MPNWKKVITSGSEASLNKLVVDGSIGHVSASLFSGSFYGDGSNLTGLGNSAFQDTGSMTVLNADSADTAIAVNIGTLTTAGGKDILYTGGSGKVSQDTSGEFTYDPDANQLSVGEIIIEQPTNGRAIDILNANSRWRQYIDSSGHITLNASGSGANTNVNYTLEKGNFNVNLTEGHFNLDIDNTGKDFRIRDSGNVTYFVVTGDKKVGIGEAVGTTPGQDVDIAGTVRIRDYGSGTKTGTLAYTLGVDSNGDLIETTGGTDTNIANTDLTATANRTLDMGTNDLTISASQFFIDTTGGTFEVDARNGDFRVISDTGHDIELQGLPNTETPNIVGYNTATGRLSYYSTGSFSGGGGSTVYTPDIYEIQTENTITANDTALAIISTGAGGPTILDGTTGTERNPLDVHVVDFNSTGVFEITYTVNLSHGDPATDVRMNPAIYAKAGDAGVGGTLSEVHGSLNATYIRLPGTNSGPNGSIHGKFYYNNTTAAHSLVLYLTFLGTTSNTDIDIVNHVSGLKNTLTIRKIS